MKKLSRIAVVLGLSCGMSVAAYAGSLQPNSTGAYAYAGIGVQMFNQHVRLKYTPPYFSEYNGRIALVQQPVYGHFGVGYGFAFDETFYVAAEVAYDYLGTHLGSQFSQNNSMHSYDFHQSLRYQMKSGHQLEVSALLGGNLVHNTLAYVKLGYVGTWINNTLNYTIDDSDQGYRPWPYTARFKQFRNGALLGTGVRLPVSNRIQLVAEYDFIAYANKNQNVTAYISKDIHDAMQNTHVNFKWHSKLSSNNVSVALLLKF